MNDKLFDIKAEERLVTFTIATYNNNRVLSKLFKQLKEEGEYKIKKGLDLFKPEIPIFEVSINSNKDLVEIYIDFKYKLVAIIPDLFPLNYQFDFIDQPFGFIHSFDIIGSTGLRFSVYHKIKEIRTNGNSVPLKADNQINY